MLDDDVTLQCDASQFGLGDVLLQHTQPRAHASRAMTSTETKWSPIDKECLAISWACKKFDHYLYGRHAIHLESDHKPLETIFKKALDTVPLRLQKLLRRLQRYNLAVTYKKGADMCLADPPTCQQLKTPRRFTLVDHRDKRSISSVGWEKISQASANDPHCEKLSDMIL